MIKTQIFKVLDINGRKEKVVATSYSQMETFLQCPRRWYLDYLLGQRAFQTSEALALGSAVHETLEKYFLSVKDGEEFTVAEAQDMLQGKIEEHEVPFANQARKEEAEQQHYSMMKGLVNGDSELAQFMSDKEIVACEKNFVYEVKLPFSIIFDGKKYNSVYVVGSIDFIVKDKDGGLHVVDFKSGAKAFQAKKLKENLQLPIYSLVVLQQYGRLPVSTQYYFTRLDCFQSVKTLALDSTCCEHDYYKNGNIKLRQRTVDEILDELIGIYRRIYVECDYSANGTPLCSWCGHSPIYGDQSQCNDAMRYIRKDISIPKKPKRIIKAFK